MRQIDMRIDWNPALRDAWQLVREPLRVHIRKCNRAYRAANAVKKQLIRDHNPIFDAVLRWTEDDGE